MMQTDPVDVGRWTGDNSVVLPKRCRSPMVQKKLICDSADNFVQHCVNAGEDLLGEVPQSIRHELVEYLTIGDTELLNISESNFHDYLHVAIRLNHASLFKVCCMFFSENRLKIDLQTAILTCNCYNSLASSLCRVQCTPVCTCQKSATRPGATLYGVLFPKTKKSPDKNMAVIVNLSDFSVITIQTPKRLEHKGHGFAVCAIYRKECPYVVVSGGEGKHATALDRYDVILNKWESPARMKYARVNHLMVPVDGCVYIIGGNDCNSIEKLHPSETKTVQLETKLLVEVRSASAAVWQEKVFIFGGKSQRGHVSCVQCFDTRTCKVVRLPDLPCQCSGGQAAVVNDLVFIATHQGHMIMFDPRTGHSELQSHQPIIRKHFFMCVKNGDIFITDGVRTDDGRTDSIRMEDLPICKYSPEKDVWTKLPSHRSQNPIKTGCVIELKKRCPVVPFMDMYLY